jgi:hypothetical protein
MRYSQKSMLLLALSTLAWADGANDLHASLQRLQGHTSVKVEVVCTLHQEYRTFLKPVIHECSQRLQAGEDETGLHVDWNLPSREVTLHDSASPDPGTMAGSPFGDALGVLDAVGLEDLLNQAVGLSHMLKTATFMNEGRENYLGNAVRILTFTCKPSILSQHQGLVAQGNSTLKIWIGDDGVPLATELLVDYYGRHSRLYGRIHSHTLVKTTYAVMGQRLLAASRTSEDAIYDYGDQLKRRKTMTLSQKGGWPPNPQLTR